MKSNKYDFSYLQRIPVVMFVLIILVSAFYWVKTHTNIRNDQLGELKSFAPISKDVFLESNYTIYGGNLVVYEGDVFLVDIFEAIFVNKTSLKMNRSTLIRTLKQPNEWKMYTIRKDPFTRFLHNYATFCQFKDCLNCSDDLKCFLDKLHLIVTSSSIKTTNPLSSFFPYTWRTNLKSDIQKYIRIQENDTRPLNRLMHQFNITNLNLLSLARPQIPHNVTSIEQSLLTSKALLHTFTSIYFHDFVVFGFELPLF